MFEVVEMFESINGEGTHAGQLAFFVRFKGCNLSCSYCDTKWANQKEAEFKSMSAEDIYAAVLKSGITNVTLTGGEPLNRHGIGELLDLLSKDERLYVEVETNGSISLEPFADKANRPSMTMDYKLPSSGMEGSMDVSNFAFLDKRDTVKFVVGSEADLDRAREIIEKYDLINKCSVYLSPVFGKIEPDNIVEYLKKYKLNNVTLQLQLHKIIWDPDMKGV